MAQRPDDVRNQSFPSVDKQKETKEPQTESKLPHTPRASARPPGNRQLFLIILGVVCLALACFLARAYSNVGELNLSLLRTRGDLVSTADKLRDSQDQIVGLKGELLDIQSETARDRQQIDEHSHAIREHSRQLSGQSKMFRSLGARVEADRGQYHRELAEIELEKADRAELQEIREKVDSLPASGNTGGEGPDVKQPADSVPEEQPSLDQPESTPGQGAALDRALPPNDARAAAAPGDEVYGFELQEQDGILWLLDVGLDLKKVELEKGRYDIEIRSDGQKLRKKKQNQNDPIDFQIAGLKKPYRLVVTELDENRVQGYLKVAEN